MTSGEERDSPDNLDDLAAEYVLGTLAHEQRQALVRRLEHDRALREAVDAWEQRLQPMQALASEHPPSAYLWQRIERSLDNLAPAAVKDAPQRWWQRATPWRWTSAAGLAASLLLAILLLREAPVATPSYLVVLVAPRDHAPGWVVQASSPHRAELIPLGMVEVPADKALQFWTKADGWSGPVSLGLIKPGERVEVPLETLPPLENNQLFELTLEGPTGSPTGKPSGPIQFIGRAVKVL